MATQKEQIEDLFNDTIQNHSFDAGFGMVADVDYFMSKLEPIILKDKIAHADKVIGTDIRSAIGDFNEKDAKAHASVQEFCDFVNYHKGLMRKRNK